MITDYFMAGDLMVARLRDQLPVPANQIRLAGSMDWVMRNPVSSSVNVVFLDDIVVEDKGNQYRGRVQLSDQVWLVIVSVRNVAANAGVGALVTADPIIMATLKALQGFKLSGDYGELHRHRCPFRRTDMQLKQNGKAVEDGFTHIPFMFSTRITIGG